MLRERLAEVQHEIWAHWMKYLFSIAKENKNGTYTIPHDKAEHWMRLIETSYQELTEKEKSSDREQADKILSVLKNIS